MKLLFYVLLCLSVKLSAQIGIGTDRPNSNAILDIESNNKGVKLPRLKLQSIHSPSPLIDHVAGMIVYNTNVSGNEINGIGEGLYINDGTQWVLLQKSFNEEKLVPVASVFYLAKLTPPSGYLVCDGRKISKVQYPELYAAIGNVFTPKGVNVSNEEFYLPDLRGEFIRGFDGGNQIDKNRIFGSFQNFQTEDHTHLPVNDTSGGYVTHKNGDGSYNNDSFRAQQGTNMTFGLYNSTGKMQSTSGNIGLETRPRNIALLPVIKY